MSMRWKLLLVGLGLLPAATSATAGDAYARPTGCGNCAPKVYYHPAPCPTPGHPGQPVQPGQPMPQPGQPMPQPGQPVQPEPMAPADMFAQAPPAGTEGGGTFNPQVIGDLGASTFVQGGSSSAGSTTPIVSRGAFKIAENESPRPLDRIFINYNYFQDIGIDRGTGNLPNLHRETVGFEKTIGRNASIGLRVPFMQEDPEFFGGNFVGDLSIIGKWALINSCDTGNVLSMGLVVTVPTGEDINGNGFNGLVSDDGWLFQPFVGYILNGDRAYAQGFTAVVFPTDPLDTVLFTQDLAVGYRLLDNRDCDAILRYVVPTIEGHATIPLSNRGTDEVPVGFPDIFVLTGGVHLGLFDRLNLTFGAATPLTGPRPFEWEGIVQLNFLF